jgi:hypothetical protein
MSNVWTYKDDSWTEGMNIIGYSVDATDGSIGKVDDATNDTSASYIVVDTGPWIFGKKRLVPAGAITAVDHEDNRVTVSMTKDQIKSAPDYDASDWNDASRDRHADYYRDYSW